MNDSIATSSFSQLHGPPNGLPVQFPLLHHDTMPLDLPQPGSCEHDPDLVSLHQYLDLVKGRELEYLKEIEVLKQTYRRDYERDRSNIRLQCDAELHRRLADQHHHLLASHHNTLREMGEIHQSDLSALRIALEQKWYKSLQLAQSNAATQKMTLEGEIVNIACKLEAKGCEQGWTQAILTYREGECEELRRSVAQLRQDVEQEGQLTPRQQHAANSALMHVEEALRICKEESDAAQIRAGDLRSQLQDWQHRHRSLRAEHDSLKEKSERKTEEHLKIQSDLKIMQRKLNDNIALRTKAEQHVTALQAQKKASSERIDLDRAEIGKLDKVIRTADLQKKEREELHRKETTHLSRRIAGLQEDMKAETENNRRLHDQVEYLAAMLSKRMRTAKAANFELRVTARFLSLLITVRTRELEGLLSMRAEMAMICSGKPSRSSTPVQRRSHSLLGAKQTAEQLEPVCRFNASKPASLPPKPASFPSTPASLLHKQCKATSQSQMDTPVNKKSSLSLEDDRFKDAQHRIIHPVSPTSPSEEAKKPSHHTPTTSTFTPHIKLALPKGIPEGPRLDNTRSSGARKRPSESSESRPEDSKRPCHQR